MCNLKCINTALTRFVLAGTVFKAVSRLEDDRLIISSNSGWDNTHAGPINNNDDYNDDHDNDTYRRRPLVSRLIYSHNYSPKYFTVFYE